MLLGRVTGTVARIAIAEVWLRGWVGSNVSSKVAP